jgi:hypothetical protein
MNRYLAAIAIPVGMGLITACSPSPSPSGGSGATPERHLELNPGVTLLATDQLPPVVTGQVIYVPIYSEIYDLGPNRPFQLTATLSLRNTDPDTEIVIESADYYDSAGTLVSPYLNQPIQLAPLTSTAVVVDSRHTLGGTGANFLVTWRAAAAVSPPVVEAIMISTASQQGVSFVSVGRVIQER